MTIAAASVTGLAFAHSDFDLPRGRFIHTGCPHHYRFARPGESEEQFATRLAAELDARIIGFASGGPSRDEDAEAAPAEVYAIYVEPAAWGRGAGRRLLERLEAALLGSDFDAATLWVLEDNPRARRFYARQGWRDSGAIDYNAETSSGAIPVPCRRYEKRVGPEGNR